jgi:hypothetical protein
MFGSTLFLIQFLVLKCSNELKSPPPHTCAHTPSPPLPDTNKISTCRASALFSDVKFKVMLAEERAHSWLCFLVLCNNTISVRQTLQFLSSGRTLSAAGPEFPFLGRTAGGDSPLERKGVASPHGATVPTEHKSFF